MLDSFLDLRIRGNLEAFGFAPRAIDLEITQEQASATGAFKIHEAIRSAKTRCIEHVGAGLTGRNDQFCAFHKAGLLPNLTE